MRQPRYTRLVCPDTRVELGSPQDRERLPSNQEEPIEALEDPLIVYDVGSADATNSREDFRKWQPDHVCRTTRVDSATGPRLTSTESPSNPEGLYQLLRHPPRVTFHVQGYPRTKQRKCHKKSRVPRTVDFDLKVDMSACFQGPASGSQTWHTITPPAFRATTYRGDFSMRDAKVQPHTAIPVEAWCDVYAATLRQSWLPLTFVLKREPAAWGEAYFAQAVKGMIRRTGYVGHVETKIVVEDGTLIVKSPHWVNRLRDDPVIWWFCVVSCLWIVTWPVLWLCTRRFEVVVAEWPMKKERKVQGQVESVFASCSEQEWIETWGEAVVDHAYRREVGWVNDVMMRQYCDLKRDHFDSGMFSRTWSPAFCAFVGHVDARTGLTISPHGRVKPAGPWGSKFHL
ncbi:hypothetical protein MBLNU459_g4399t1 [Dothideomycetes sp. NU459]